MVWRIQGADANATNSLLEQDLADGLAKLKDTTGAGELEDKTIELILEKIENFGRKIFKSFQVVGPPLA